MIFRFQLRGHGARLVEFVQVSVEFLLKLHHDPQPHLTLRRRYLSSPHPLCDGLWQRGLDRLSYNVFERGLVKFGDVGAIRMF
ncbi:hypothetical protein D3C87_1920490 [compost metagenome]